jgi:hypothetical protein
VREWERRKERQRESQTGWTDRESGRRNREREKGQSETERAREQDKEKVRDLGLLVVEDPQAR